MVKRYYASFAHEVTPHCKTDCQEFVLASDYDDLNDRYRALTATGDGWHECEGCDTPRDCKYHGCGVAREIRGWERTVGPTPPAPVIPTTAVEVPLSEGPKPYCKCVLNGQRWLPEECPIHRPTDGSGGGQ